MDDFGKFDVDTSGMVGEELAYWSGLNQCRADMVAWGLTNPGRVGRRSVSGPWQPFTLGHSTWLSVLRGERSRNGV